jgi:hypothetical protein
MNYSYATLEEAWKESRSPTPSSDTSSTFSNETLVISKPNMSSQNLVATRDYVVSPSPSVSPSSYSGLGSPISTSSDSRSQSPSPSNSSIESSVLLNERLPEPGTPGTLPGLSLSGKKEESKIIRHILRVHEDIKAAMKSKDDEDTASQRFPIIETGLFISVGLFVLIVMNMMLRMGKNHVSYRFTME